MMTCALSFTFDTAYLAEILIMKMTWMKNMLGDLLSSGYLYPGDTRVITVSWSSSLRCTMSLMDLDEEFTSAMGMCTCSRWFGLWGGEHGVREWNTCDNVESDAGKSRLFRK